MITNKFSDIRILMNLKSGNHTWLNKAGTALVGTPVAVPAIADNAVRLMLNTAEGATMISPDIWQDNNDISLERVTYHPKHLADNYSTLLIDLSSITNFCGCFKTATVKINIEDFEDRYKNNNPEQWVITREDLMKFGFTACCVEDDSSTWGSVDSYIMLAWLFLADLKKPNGTSYTLAEISAANFLSSITDGSYVIIRGNKVTVSYDSTDGLLLTLPANTTRFEPYRDLYEYPNMVQFKSFCLEMMNTKGQTFHYTNADTTIATITPGMYDITKGCHLRALEWENLNNYTTVNFLPCHGPMDLNDKLELTFDNNINYDVFVLELQYKKPGGAGNSDKMKVQLILATADVGIARSVKDMVDNARNYLVVHSVVDGPYIADPVAGFTYEADAVDPLTIAFTNTSTDAVFSSWNFGDYSPIDLTANPTHTYAAPGTYTVVLTVQNIAGVPDTVTQNITVLADPVADFTYVADAANPLIIEFTNTSTNAVDYRWDFGDGAVSTEENPTHTYTAPGTYTVILAVENIVGATDTKTETITV